MLKGDRSRSEHHCRLRKKFQKSPLGMLSDSETLEMLLFSVLKQKDTEAISKKLLNKFSSLKDVITADPITLKILNDICDAGLMQFKLMQDIFTRFMLPCKKNAIHMAKSWFSIINYCQFIIGTKKTEHLHVLFFNKRNILITDETISSGTVDKVIVYPREIARQALFYSASAVITVRNYSSQDLTPSKDDIDITKKIHAALSALNITLHDHLIVSHNSHFSFKAHNLI